MVPFVMSLLVGQVHEPVAMRDVWKDLSRTPELERSYRRYLIRPNSWEDKTWEAFQPLIVGHLNHLSRKAIFYHPVKVGERAIRVDVFRLGYGTVWDKMTDPYLTQDYVDKVREWPGGIYPGDGKHYPAGAFRERWKEPGTFPAIILMESKDDEKKLNDILYWTGSPAAMLRADWFLNQTLAADNRAVGYPEFLGFKDLDEWEGLIGFDKKKSEAFRFELREAMSKSGVTLKARALARYDALGGAYWKSIDFIAPKGLDHPLRLPGRGIEGIGDGFETYGVLPNGLPTVGAFNKQRKLVRAVPGNLATDSLSHSNDHQVHVGISCFRCHNEGALKELDGFFRKTFSPPLKGYVEEKDYEKALQIQEELEQQYLRQIKPTLDRDRAAYELAIKDCTGLSYKEYSKLVADAWTLYEDAVVNTAYAAREFGMTEKVFRAKLKVAIDGGYRVDLTVGSLLQEGDRAVTLSIREWEEIHGAVWNTIRGIELKE